MEDRFKFRGRHHVAGSWHYGYLFKRGEDWIITPDGFKEFKVDPKTIGRCTKQVIPDRCGKPARAIYEKDILKVHSVTTDGKSGLYEVLWSDERCCFFLKSAGEWESIDCSNDNQLDSCMRKWNWFEFVGISVENPELLTNKST